MTDYHIGQEIMKEMRRQGMKPAEFGRALNRERGTVYDIFKKRHIATDLLANICRILNHDFFNDLSNANFSKNDEEVEDSAEQKEQISSLMPETELQSFHTGYLLDEVMEEFLLSERSKPMVVFYPSEEAEIIRYDLPTKIQQLAGKLWGDRKMAEDKCKPHFTDSNLPYMYRQNGLVSFVMKDNNYSNAIEMAEKYIRSGNVHVILYIPVENILNAVESGGLIFQDKAEQLFSAWEGKAHFVYVNNGNPGILRELYLAYCRKGTIDRLINQLSNVNDVGMILFDLIFGRKILDVQEIEKEDSTGLSRIRIFYRGCHMLDENMSKLMYENGINDHPRLNMWLDIRNGYLVDFQYNKRTQS